ADAGVLCLKSGNAVMLRGGSDSFRSCRAIHDALVQGLREAGLPEAAITLVPTRDRAAVGLLLSGLNAKMRRTGVCGAAETLLVDRAGAATTLKPLVEMLIEAGCEVRSDDAVQKIDARV